MSWCIGALEPEPGLSFVVMLQHCKVNTDGHWSAAAQTDGEEEKEEGTSPAWSASAVEKLTLAL